jgi:hypothetical protein
MSDSKNTPLADPEKLELAEDISPAHQSFEKSPAEKVYYRKLLWRFMPLACIITFLQVPFCVTYIQTPLTSFPFFSLPSGLTSIP